MTARIAADRLLLLLEAAAWQHKFLYAVSFVGPERSVRQMVRHLRSEGAVELFLPAEGGARIVRASFYRPPLAHLARLGEGQAHAVLRREGVYVARERDRRREALWLSRGMGLPVPPEWVDEVLEASGEQPETYNMVCFFPGDPYAYRDLLREKKRQKVG